VIDLVSGFKEVFSKRGSKGETKIINIYDSHGEVTTKEAFGVIRKTVYVWKKKLKYSGGSRLD
jgi:hypothetical protein